MRELGLALLGSLGIFGFFGSVIYPDLEVKNHPRVHGCTGECYEKYVAEYGTTVEQLIAKREEAAGDLSANGRRQENWEYCNRLVQTYPSRRPRQRVISRKHSNSQRDLIILKS